MEATHLNEPVDRDGTLVLRDGRVLVTDPTGDGQPAVLTSAPGLTIAINGRPIDSPTPVRTADQIEILCPPVEEPAKIQVVISPDRLTATIALNPRIRRIRRPLDCSPVRQLTPDSTETVEEVWDIGIDTVLAAMAEKGVTAGIDREEIATALATRDRTPRVVARGVPPTPGEDGWIEQLFPDGPIPVTPTSEQMAVDHRQRFVLPLVKEGESLAILHPAVPGEPGQTVTGQPLPPKPVREAVLSLKDGAAFTEDGRQVVASRPGMPVGQGDRSRLTVRVDPILDHPGNVDMASGNLNFDGEIIVRGDVTQNMTVKATGGVQVFGLVEGATVEGGRDITLSGTVVGSQVRAGGSLATLHLRTLLPEFELLSSEFAQLLQGCDQLVAHGGDQAQELLRIRAGQTLMTVLGTPLKAVQNRIAQIEERVEALTEDTLPEPLAEWLESAKGLLIGLNPLNIRNIEELQQLITGLEEARATCSGSMGLPASIRAPYVQNSTLEATGSIEIHGAGCFYSTLQAGDNLTVAAVFRGSRATARGHVRIGRAGSPSATDRICEIDVSSGGIVDLGQVAPNVTIRVGHNTHRFDDTLSGVRLRLNTTGDIVIESQQD